MPTARLTNRAGSTGPFRSAFTLIEVLVALGVVVALLAVAVPVLVLSFDSRRIEAEAESLGAVVGSLRAEAVRTRTSLALYLVPPEDEWGGQLVLGPLNGDRADDGWLPGGEGVGGEGGAATQSIPDDDTLRERVIYRADRPYRLSAERPSVGLGSEFGLDPLVGAGGRGDQYRGNDQRVRIAAVSASGQVLASRLLWCHDKQRMFSVEVGIVGNAVLSGVRNIPDEGIEPEKDPADEERDAADGAEGDLIPEDGP